jgi:NAD(P)-dependent dehydrogenase (short-subunit alcohol dehydrogenase family)
MAMMAGANPIRRQPRRGCKLSAVAGGRALVRRAVAYSTSKAGQGAFTKMEALELAQHKIRINVVCPGAIRTNIGEATHPRNVDKIRWTAEFPMGTSPLAGGPGEPAQVARVIAFLLSDAADHVSGTEM